MTRRELVLLRIVYVAGMAAPAVFEFLSMRGTLEMLPFSLDVVGPRLSIIVAFSLPGSAWRRVLRAIAVPIGVIVLLAAALVVFDRLMPDGAVAVPASHVTDRLEPGADSILIALSRGVDDCLARSNRRWTPESMACACPPGGRQFRGAWLDCSVRSGIVAFDGAGLPFERESSRWRGSDYSRGYGLAYVPSGNLPVKDRPYEFLLGGFASVDPAPTTLGPRWYRVSICRICD